MPKSQYIDPKEMRKAGEITFSPIPVNQYKKTAKEELKSKHFTKDDLKRIYRDMVVIREFETMLQLVKTTGGYNGVEYNNPGPATSRPARKPLLSGWPTCSTSTTLSSVPTVATAKFSPKACVPSNCSTTSRSKRS